MDGKYRTAIVRDIAQLHSMTLSMRDREVLFSTWLDKESGSDSGIYKVSVGG